MENKNYLIIDINTDMPNTASEREKKYYIYHYFDVLSSGFRNYDKDYYAYDNGTNIIIHFEMLLDKKGTLTQRKKLNYDRCFSNLWDTISTDLALWLHGKNNYIRFELTVDVGDRVERNYKKITTVQHFGVRPFPHGSLKDMELLNE